MENGPFETGDAVQFRESNLVTHARRELALLGETDTWYLSSIIDAVRAFTAGGHSGGSAMVAIDTLERLLRYEPLTPLTDDPAEWHDVSEETGVPKWWQNVRDPRAISHDGGRTYWRVNDRRPWYSRWLGKRWYRSQPARPETA